MQGSVGNNGGLPRPYYMKPSKKKQSPYDKMPRNFFNSNKRKLAGYIVMLSLFSLVMWWVAEALRFEPDPIYEVVRHESPEAQSNLINLDNVNAKDNDKEGANADLAAGLAKGSKGDKGYAVDEAPMGGIANEAPVVGSNEDEIVGNGKPKPMQGDGVGKGKVAPAPGAEPGEMGKAKGYKADKE
ncbi:hypothetical protein DICA3_F20120 [Diutina catenulata]